MASEFTPKQLNITPALGREKAEARLTVYGDSMAREGNIAIKQAWYLVQHTDVTGRMNGEGAMAYRRLSGYQLAKMVCEIANQNIMGADVTAYMYKFMGISLEVAAVAEPEKPKTVLTWEAARELLADNPQREDIFLPYANSARLVTSIKRDNGYWDVIAGGWRMSFDGDNIAYTHPTPETVASAAPDVAQAEPVTDTRAAIKARLLSKYGDNEYEEELKAMRGKAIDFSDADIPFAAFDDSEPAHRVTWLPRPTGQAPEVRYFNQKLGYVPVAMRPTLQHKPRSRVSKRAKVSFTMNGGNIEKNTPKAQDWRKRRNLANAVNMPIPTITGAELLARGQGLTVLPKPKQLTRVLEGRAA